MAQKMYLLEGGWNKDLLQKSPVAEAIADGYEVTGVSGLMNNGVPMYYVTLSKPAEEPATPPVPFQEVVEVAETAWQEAITAADLSDYVGKTVVTDEMDAAHYVLNATHYIDLTVTELEGETTPDDSNSSK